MDELAAAAAVFTKEVGSDADENLGVDEQGRRVRPRRDVEESEVESANNSGEPARRDNEDEDAKVSIASNRLSPSQSTQRFTLPDGTATDPGGRNL